jgi:rhamnogalacturonyl hydrolase YesR
MKMSKSFRLFTVMISAGAVLWFCPVNADAGAPGGEDLFGQRTARAFEPKVVDAVGDRVAAWQIGQLDDLGYIRNPRVGDFDRRGWQHGALYSGLMRWSDLPGNGSFAEVLMQISEENEWRLGDRLFHGDDHVVGQLYLHFYARQKDQRMIEHTIRQFNQILVAAPDGSLEFTGEEIPGVGLSCQLRWCWCDALFMSPATWIGLSLATGNEQYMEYGDREFWATTDYLMDPETSLFFRDSRYLEQRDDDGSKIFWSRGNGWVYAGVVNILRTLPRDHPLRSRYFDLFLDMSSTIAGLQQDNGLWRVSLLGGEKYSVPETSGSAFMTYGLAWGVNNGHLDSDAYEPVVRKGWQALVNAVQDDGKLGWVQPVGFAPDSVFETDSHLYGVGAFLLAAEQMYLAEDRSE